MVLTDWCETLPRILTRHTLQSKALGQFAVMVRKPSIDSLEILRAIEAKSTTPQKIVLTGLTG